MGWPVNVVEAGGLPVSEAPEGYGTPIVAAPDGFGYPVTIVASGGLPVAFGEGIGGDPAYTPALKFNDKRNSMYLLLLRSL